MQHPFRSNHPWFHRSTGAERGAPASRRGLTMVEALVCVALLGVLAVIASASLPATQSAGAVGSDLATLESTRAKMEELRAGPASAFAGSDTLEVRGAPVERSWSSTACDLDGDGRVEPDAFRLHVSMGGMSLETIRTEPGGVGAIKR